MLLSPAPGRKRSRGTSPSREAMPTPIGPSPGAALADAVQVRIGSVDQFVSRDRRGGRDPFAELVGAQQRKLFSRFDDERRPVVVAQVDAAGGGDWRRVASA